MANIEFKTFTEDDAVDFFHLTQDEGFNAFPISIYRQASVESAREWIRKAMALNQATSLGKWGVWELQTESLIGIGGLTPWKFGEEELIDITYRLKQSVWGKGYGLELAQALVNYGFNGLGLRQITATIVPENIPSKVIAQKLGMKFDQQILLQGVATDLYRLNHQ